MPRPNLIPEINAERGTDCAEISEIRARRYAEIYRGVRGRGVFKSSQRAHLVLPRASSHFYSPDASTGFYPGRDTASDSPLRQCLLLVAHSSTSPDFPRLCATMLILLSVRLCDYTDNSFSVVLFRMKTSRDSSRSPLVTSTTECVATRFNPLKSIETSLRAQL